MVVDTVQDGVERFGDVMKIAQRQFAIIKLTIGKYAVDEFLDEPLQPFTVLRALALLLEVVEGGVRDGVPRRLLVGRSEAALVQLHDPGVAPMKFTLKRWPRPEAGARGVLEREVHAGLAAGPDDAQGEERALEPALRF